MEKQTILSDVSYSPLVNIDENDSSIDNILEAFYLGEFEFSDGDSKYILNVLENAETIDFGRLEEFVFYLISKDYNFNGVSDNIMKIVNKMMKELIKDQTLFHDACIYGYLNIVKYTVKRDSIIDFDLAFIYAACNGHLDILEYLVSVESPERKTNIHEANESAFLYALRGNHIHVTTYMIKLEPTHGGINIHVDNEYIFMTLASTGSLVSLKYLISLESTHGKINIHADNEYAFRAAAEFGHIHILRYLIRLESTHGIININVEDDYSFRMAAKNGHIYVLKYLILLEQSHDEINIHTDNDYAFKHSIKNKHVYEYLNELKALRNK